MIAIDFQLEKYIPFKETDVSNFFMQYNVTVMSHNDVPYFYMNQTAYGAVNTKINRILMLFIALKWLKRTNMKDQYEN